MNELTTRYGISPDLIKRGRRLKVAAWTAPIVTTTLPAAAFVLLSVLATGTNIFPLTVFIGLIVTAIGFISGLVLSGVLAYKHSKWTGEMRELMASHGIKPEELNWFRNELRPNEKRTLKAFESGDLLLADAYRETLATRLTATRIIRSSKRELQATKQRQQKIKQLRTETTNEFRGEIEKDIQKIGSIHSQAKEMLAEAESRLQMIDAAAARGSTLAGDQLALKKLELRNSELPIALKEAQQTHDYTIELEKELAAISESQAADHLGSEIKESEK